jgi:hypothetical protein
VALERGGAGQFDVVVDGEVVARKARIGLFDRLTGLDGFPEPRRVLDLLRDRLAGGGGGSEGAAFSPPGRRRPTRAFLPRIVVAKTPHPIG